MALLTMLGDRLDKLLYVCKLVDTMNAEEIEQVEIRIAIAKLKYQPSKQPVPELAKQD